MESDVKLIKGSQILVRKPRPAQKRFIFSRWYVMYLAVFHLYPRYLYHFLLSPYWRDRPPEKGSSHQPSRAEPWYLSLPTKVRRRFRPKKQLKGQPTDGLDEPSQKATAIAKAKRTRSIRAMGDAIISFSLDGYAELAKTTIAPATGQMMVFLLEFIGELDDYLDKHLSAGTPPSMTEVLADPHIIEQIAKLYRYTEPFGCAISILKHMRELLIIHYDTYIQACVRARSSLQFEDTLEVAKIDTGICCRIKMEVACLFNGHQLDYELLDDFYWFGLVGKFGDELIDLESDIAKGLPNLFWALTRQYPQEHARLQAAIQDEHCLTTAWCKKHCPLTFRSYFEQIVFYYQRIRSAKVKRLALLILAGYNHTLHAPTLIGGDLGS